MLSACSEAGGVPARAGDGDLAARCERSAKTAPGQPPHASALRLVPVGSVGDEETSPLGKVVGAAWHPRERRLYVLDAFNGGVSVFDSTGRRVARFGGIGGGPGEFEELGGGHGARPVYNQLALLGDGRIAVMELGRLHVFTADGRFVQRIRVTDSDPGPFAVLHVAGFDGGSVLFSETGAMRMSTDDPAERTALRLVRASLRGEALDTAAFGGIRNNLNRMPPFRGMPPWDPYLAYYRRVWDALPSGLLAVPSQFTPAVCFFDGSGTLLSTLRMDLPAIPVDHAERERVLDGFRASAGDRPPMGAGSWEEQYPSWPRTVPPFADVALAPDSAAWLLRPLRGGGTLVDRVHPTRGYLGSLPAPGGRLPLTFDAACAYVLEERAPDAPGAGGGFYGLRRWCPAASSAPAAARTSSAHPERS
jgi:hypothetical protein